MVAPEIDNLIESFPLDSGSLDFDSYQKLVKIYGVFSCIKPVGDDDTRKIWFQVSRGSINDFGEYEDYKEEGIVDNHGQFENLWKDYYPTKIKWYSFATAKFQKELYFYFDSKLIISIREDDVADNKTKIAENAFHKFLDWLLYSIQEEIKKVEQDTYSYNKYLEKELSHHKRFGKIKRKVFWRVWDDEANRIDERLGPMRIDKLRKFIDESQKPDYSTPIPQITANAYFKYCEICYDANDYFKDSMERLSPKEKYLYMSDGRDAGLRNIEGDSENAFFKWYHDSKRVGAHPWEICRGGNATHISLFVSHSKNNWLLTLEGSSIARVEETVKMAIALYENRIPFMLDRAEALLNMATGNDYIGIVPDYITPRYCNSLFPDEDRIIDFLHLDYEEEEIIIPNAYWYTLEKIETNNNDFL